MLDAVDIKELREKKKSIRFCPNCGYRRVVGFALHYVCGVCSFKFVTADADDLEEYCLVQVSDDTARFRITSEIKVFKGWEGLKDMF